MYHDDGLIHGPWAHAATARWVLDLYSLNVPATDPRWEEVGGKRLLSHCDCVQNGDAESPCAGAVEHRASLDPAGRRLALCERHRSERVSDWPDTGSQASPKSCEGQ